jgi:alpha-beta hydrolase superfamily lysophospholipase
MDIQIKLSNGNVLRGIIKSPGEDIKAGIILVHGIGEHIQRYSHLMERFNKKGYGIVGVDLPGHGKSDGKRGNLNSYTLTDEMLNLLITEFKKTFPGTPVFIYGHSLGGGIVLQYIIQKKPGIKGAIVTSPWLRLSYEPNKIKLGFARMMNRLFPSFTQSSGLIVNHISHDQQVVKDYLADPLNHNKISAGLFHSASTAGNYSLQHAGELRIPILIMHGADDLITSPKATGDFASRTKLAELKIWDGGYHELHNEVFRDEVISFTEGWIEKNLKG